MEQLPKIVQERLRATAKPGVHPDPDLLSAFAEKSLAAREHNAVLEHLANCADCRDVLALAGIEQVRKEEGVLDFVAAAAAPHSPPARPGWLRAPMLRWTGIAASILVVSAVALLFVERRSPRTAALMVAKAPEAELSAPRAASISDAAATKSENSDKEVREELLAKQVAPAAVKALKTSRPDIHSRKLDQRQMAGNELADAVAPAPPPAPLPAPSRDLQNVQIMGAPVAKAGSAAASPAAQAAKDSQVYGATRSEGLTLTAAAPTAEAASAGPVASVKAKSINGAVSAPLTGQLQRDPFQYTTAENRKRSENATLSAAMLPVKWAISPEGKLQKSTDAGKTWAPVPVADNQTFHAVSAFGIEIWVGGDAGLLYHSSDGGGHWVQVKASFLGTPLTANITHIEFLDALHGRLSTANQETWATTDGGATWLKR